MLDWLHRMKQTPAAIERFWRVVLVSALDEELARTDARYGIDVFWKAFLSNRDGFRLGIPAVPLAELYDGCREAIEKRGGEVRTRAAVREFRVEQARMTSVIFDDGSEAPADAFVMAVPRTSLLEIIGPALAESDTNFAGLRHLHDAPITGVHLWFDRRVMDVPFLTLLDHTVQWIFNKSLLHTDAASALSASNGGNAVHSETADSRPAVAAGQYLQLVISASDSLVPLSRQEIINLCLAELHEALPETRRAVVLKATVIKETAATFSPEPGSDQWRPPQQSPLKNLFLAGDWTATGWPATMEGAVRSGYLAAEAVLAAAGCPGRLVCPDLPVEPLARLASRL